MSYWNLSSLNDALAKENAKLKMRLPGSQFSNIADTGTVVNENSEQLAQGFESSCIAHEIGHWALHIDHHGVEKQRILGLDSCRVEPLHKIYRKNIQDRIEWQAQYFAGCLLMPRYKLEEGRRGRDLTNWKHLAAMAHELGVTKSNLTYRLKDLGWIDIPKGSKRIYAPIVVSG